jgi:hypothetical protein
MTIFKTEMNLEKTKIPFDVPWNIVSNATKIVKNK